MTYLELVNRAKMECGISGAPLTTVAGITNEMLRLATWVNQSWIEIQEEMQWDWRRKPVTFNSVANQQTYTVGTGLDIDLSDFAEWRNDSFRAYLQTAGVGTEVILSQYYNYSEFRDFYMLGSRRLVTGRPLYFTIEPASRSILLGFTPNDVYVVSGEYYRSPQELTADSDTPIMPTRYHMAIVYKAMQKYGLFEAAPEQVQAGEKYYGQMINRMRIDQMPMVMATGSLI